MFHYVLSKNPKRLLDLPSSRSLFTRAKRSGETELVLTNNAGMFGAYWSLNHHASVEHSAVHVVCFPFWLDKINPQHENRDWGQTLLGLPTTIRTIFKQIYPNYPLDKLITWKMMQELRNFTVHELKAMQRVHLHDLRGDHYPTDYKGFFKIALDAEKIKLGFRDQTILTVPASTEVYNWVKVPRLHRLSFLPERSHTDLYTHHPKIVPSPILIMGDGLSVVWLQRDFPKHQVIAIVPDKNARLPELPANAAVNYDKIAKITVDDILEVQDEQITIHLNGKTVRIPSSNYASAIGYIPYTDLTSQIPNNQKTERLEIPADSWIAPRNIPVGSLTQSLTKFFEETGNLDGTFELQFHHIPSIVEVLRTRLHNDFGIELKEAFFDKLRLNISTLKDPLNEAGELNLFVDTFKDAQNSPPTELLLFEKAIQAIQQDKNLQISNYKPTASSNNQGSSGSNVPHNNTMLPAFKRSYSSLAHSGKYQGMLPEEARLRMQEMVLMFFQPDKEKIRTFDKTCQEKVAGILTKEDRAKMKTVLEEAKNSQKTFSAY